MSGSVFGRIFKISSWGESHGKAIGVTIDGCPSNLELSEEDIQVYLDRRKPARSEYSTSRSEADRVEILSGVFEGKTTGAPISLIVMNTSQRSSDYDMIRSSYRPGHADYCYDEKYGFRDYRGGGRSSGRETVARVAAGAVAAAMLKELGVSVRAYTLSIGDICSDRSRFDFDMCGRNPLYMPDMEAAERAARYLDGLRESKDSAGGVVECVVSGLRAGVGEPVFDKFDALLAQGIMSIGAVKAVEIGEGINASKLCGSGNNDSFIMCGDKVTTLTNHSGGILGGISNGNDIMIRASFKPTPSIYREQRTVNSAHEEINIAVKGRHDPVIVPRAVVVVEMMTALVTLDMMLASMTSDFRRIKEFFKD